MHYGDFLEGRPGFVVMSTDVDSDSIAFVFDRFYITSDAIEEQSQYVYQLKR